MASNSLLSHSVLHSLQSTSLIPPQFHSYLSSVLPSPLSFSISSTTNTTNSSYTHMKPLHAVNVEGPTSSGPDPRSGVAIYKPKTYEVLVSDASRSLEFALDEGKTRLEIDFP